MCYISDNYQKPLKAIVKICFKTYHFTSILKKNTELNGAVLILILLRYSLYLNFILAVTY